ncbi:hypothetical protein B0H34DRAFT_15995 [Crassisporium funariophilum]|nr:hypothetical protein B0H34DRAFT_15995 [Crassisporium funariophilum]
MASIVTIGPITVEPLTYDSFPASPPLVQRRFPKSPASPAEDRPRSHYRPHSTLFAESSYIDFKEKRARLVKRSSSVGGLQALSNMGISFKDKVKAVKKDQSSKPTKISESVSLKPSTTVHFEPSTSSKSVLRPSTSSGISSRPAPAPLHRVKKKRSMASLFTASEDAPPSPSDSVPPSPLGSASILLPPKPLESASSPVGSVSTIKRGKSSDGRKVMDYFDSSPRFVPKNIWAKRHNMKMHPHQNDAPYMQAYDPILLESDRYSDLLLLRLSNGSPSFHDYGKKPPATVLDLGCGPGHWVLHAANVWKTSQITGLDLVDVTLPAFETTENAHFSFGNFLAFKLPFPDKSFDFVRMANLSLCVPYTKWDFVFNEVQRVLTINGRLELIDDQIYFPYGVAPKATCPSSSKGSSSSSFDDFDSDDLDEDSSTLQGEESGDTSSTLDSSEGGHSSSSSDGKHSLMVESPTIRPISAMLPPTPSTAVPLTPNTAMPVVEPFPYPPLPVSYDYESPHDRWQRSRASSTQIENLFQIMLPQAYGIFPRPSEFILDIMQNVFGKEAAGKSKSFHVKIAPPDSPIGRKFGSEDDDEVMKSTGLDYFDGAHGHSTGHGTFNVKKKVWMVEWERNQKKKKEKKAIKKSGKDKDKEGSKADTSTSSASSSERSSLESAVVIAQPPLTVVQTPVPPSMSTKAANRLGITIPPIGGPGEQGRSESARPVSPKPFAGPTAVPTTITSKAAARLGISLCKTQIPASKSSSSSPPNKTPSPPTLAVPAPITTSTSTSNASKQAQVQAPILSAKAAGRLGISYSDLAAATILSTRANPPGPAPPLRPIQSPGILVWPNTYIPVSAAELEMHACKFLHTLLGCKPALMEYVSRFREDGEGGSGKRFVEDAEFEEAIWDYECFRRPRFNWPSEIPDPFDEEPLGPPLFSPSTVTPHVLKSISSGSHSRSNSADSFNGQYQMENLTHLRTIRVFQAMKLEDKLKTVLGPPPRSAP